MADRAEGTAEAYNINIVGGTSRTFLSTTADGGRADLFTSDDASGRQKWIISQAANGDWYNIKVSGGIHGCNPKKEILSSNGDGSKLHLAPADDGSGRQRWLIVEGSGHGNQGTGDWYNIRVFGGTKGNNKYLSTTGNGRHVALVASDDGSGRQRWTIPGWPQAQLDDEAADDHEQSNEWQVEERKTTTSDMKRTKIPAWCPGGETAGKAAGKRKGIPAWNGSKPEGCKRQRSDDGPIVGVDAEGRPYNLKTVVVNFANVGAAYAKKVLKRTYVPGDQMLFDWEGVRRCVMFLTRKLGLKVVGVIFENFWGTDNNSPNKKEIPVDIMNACESIEETPRLVGKNHRSADDEMTIKCAYHRNCRFMDNDNYRDWKQQLRDEGCRAWLERCQDLLHMRYYFDSSIGVFETLDGNVPPGLLASVGMKIPAAR